MTGSGGQGVVSRETCLRRNIRGGLKQTANESSSHDLIPGVGEARDSDSKTEGCAKAGGQGSAGEAAKLAGHLGERLGLSPGGTWG